jgi:hypothetical protein
MQTTETSKATINLSTLPLFTVYMDQIKRTTHRQPVVTTNNSLFIFKSTVNQAFLLYF